MGTEKQRMLCRELGPVALGGARGPFRLPAAQRAHSQHSPKKGRNKAGVGIWERHPLGFSSREETGQLLALSSGLGSLKEVSETGSSPCQNQAGEKEGDVEKNPQLPITLLENMNVFRIFFRL